MPTAHIGQWAALKALLPHLWPKARPDLRVRTVLALVFLLTAKLATVYVPIFYKQAVDALSVQNRDLVVLPVRHPCRLRLRSRAGAGLRRAARRGLRQGGAARDPQCGARDLPASARAVAALPSRPADRRPVARHRARHQGDRVPALLLLFSILPTIVEIALVSGILWWMFDWRFAAVTLVDRARLCRLHLRHHRMAPQIPSRHERERQRGQHQGDRQPAQLRDGQVFRQRGPRGAPLRRGLARLREGGGEERDEPRRSSMSGRPRSSRSAPPS